MDEKHQCDAQIAENCSGSDPNNVEFEEVDPCIVNPVEVDPVPVNHKAMLMEAMARGSNSFWHKWGDDEAGLVLAGGGGKEVWGEIWPWGITEQVLGIYEREGWAKAERELADERREGEAAERRWLEELGVAQARPPSSTMLGETSSQGPPPSSLLEELGVARAQAPPSFSTQQVVMRTGMFDPFQVVQAAAPQFHLQTLSYPGPVLPSSLTTPGFMPCRCSSFSRTPVLVASPYTYKEATVPPTDGRVSSPYTYKEATVPPTECRLSSPYTYKEATAPTTEGRLSSPYTYKEATAPPTECRLSSPYTYNKEATAPPTEGRPSSPYTYKEAGGAFAAPTDGRRRRSFIGS